MKKGFILTCLITVITSFIFSQNASIEWGKRMRFRGNVTRIVNSNQKDVTAVVQRYNLFTAFFPNQQRLTLRHVTNLTLGEEHKIQLRGGGRKVIAKDVVDLGTDLIAISSRPRALAMRNEIYTHRFNYNTFDRVQEGQEALSYFEPQGPSVKSQTGACNSDDFTKAAVYYTIPVRQGDFPGFGYVLFNETGIYDKQTQQLPYVNHQLEIFDHFLANNGDFYVLAKEFYRHNQQNPWSIANRYFAKIRAFKVSGGKFTEFEINQPGMVIQEVKLATDASGNLIASGYYADDVFSGVRGVFMLNLDRQTNAITDVKRVPFTSEFLSAGVAAWERSFRDRWRANGARQQGLGNFKMLELQRTADGDFIGISEHQEIEIREKISGSGENQTVKIETLHYYDDMIVFRISANGTMKWVKRIPKVQQSVNDNGYYLSTAFAVTGNKVYLYFNDNKRNYLADGSFNDRDFPFTANMTRMFNVIASVEIDAQDGSVQRKMLPGRAETSTLFVPKLMRYDMNKKEMLLYGRVNRRHSFGRIILK